MSPSIQGILRTSILLILLIFPIEGEPADPFEILQQFGPIEEELTVPLVSPEYLTVRLYDRDILILDVRELDGYLDGHIPGAIPVDVGRLLSMAERPPTKEELEGLLRGYGIEPGKRIVLYDTGEGVYASLLFFLLIYGGYEDVSILDGGISRWEREGWPLEWGMRPVTGGSFEVDLKEGLVVDRRWLKKNRNAKDLIVVDTRSPLHRAEPEELDSLKVVNIPWRKNLKPSAEGFRRVDSLKELYRSQGVDEEKGIVIYGRNLLGTTVTFFALWMSGYRDLHIYRWEGR